MLLIGLCTYFFLFRFTSCSTLTAPPQSALLVAFENVYDLSLLANTLSDQGIDATLIVPSYAVNDLYDNLIDVEILQLNVNFNKSEYSDSRALEVCESLLKDKKILQKVQEFQPTFTIFPALRHDGCLIPWVKYIDSIPVIWTGNSEEESYVFECTGVALPVHNNGLFTHLINFASRSILSTVKNNYLLPAARLTAEYLPDINSEHIYSDVHLVLWGADTVLRSDFAVLTQMFVESGCHHCRGPHPLLAELQKSLIEHRSGTIVALVDENYKTLVKELAKKLPQGREGQAVVWRIKKDITDEVLPANLFIRGDVDRQDLIGYSRTRVILSHCADTEFLEAAFHGTPVICLPRNKPETRNTIRAVELGFARSVEAKNDYASAEEITNIVNDIHETVAYRESARKVSLAIRDRLNPASDRLIYWLGYVARTKGESQKFFKAKFQVKTVAEDKQFFTGVLIGLTMGITAAIAIVLVRSIIAENEALRTKGRYMQ